MISNCNHVLNPVKKDRYLTELFCVKCKLKIGEWYDPVRFVPDKLSEEDKERLK